MIAEFIIETIFGELIFGLFWATGYAILKVISLGDWQVRSYALFTVERWPTDERGIYAWVAVLVGAVFWLSLVALLIYLLFFL